MHPRFVEDCVREMLRMATERLARLGDDAFVSARQENLETIHKHNVVAERHGLMGELVRELESGVHTPHQVTMREWLEATATPEL
jgi:GTP cyclohydrolase I/GTP cyclohydrolase-4